MKKDGLGMERLLIFLTGLNLILRIVLYVQEKRAANEEDQSNLCHCPCWSILDGLRQQLQQESNVVWLLSQFFPKS